MAERPRFKHRNPRNKQNSTKDKAYIPQKPYVRDQHRDPEFETSEELVDTKYRVVTDINNLRRENEKLKKEIKEKEKEFFLNESAKMEANEKENKDSFEAFQIKRLLTFMQQLDDLKILQNELTSQYDFLVKYYSEFNQRELQATAGLQSQRVEEHAEELAKMEVVVRKAYERLEGPVATQRALFKQQKRKIKYLKKELKRVRNEEAQIESSANYNVKDFPLLPEELEVVVIDLKHKLEIEKHRKFNRLKEIEQTRKRYTNRKIAVKEQQSLKQISIKESEERSKFREKWQKIHQKEDEERRRLYGSRKSPRATLILLSDDFDDTNENEKSNEAQNHTDDDDKWSPITFAEQAHD
ncbi:hypothetical protein TRFO_27625 [Tritrichomonas foetus]|uniref:Uncharacterized protein n=1 Tax=Tritrichomonas foetus TaxID=1144522 RepID=A0A1J4K087_9EUKA|nr:hypothetical protein TRFO_27625 [Tritrichomonas foetus]|eukprot:OHT04833.1 hypothetical protein TRFO_27625 [Tritrichomonas foetus]